MKLVLVLMIFACRRGEKTDADTVENSALIDADADGYSSSDGDCDDENEDVNPAAEEVCDGIDNDCDEEVDEGVTVEFYRDNDDDGYGNGEEIQAACEVPEGYVEDALDCDDENEDVNPAAEEVCDGIDNDCDEALDEDVKTTFFTDNDGDGFGEEGSPVEACNIEDGLSATAGDCDDTNSEISPDAEEICDEIDNNCNTEIDENVKTTYYFDFDQDGYGDPNETMQACDAPMEYVENALDCNDIDTLINPAAEEVCDDVDNDCDTIVDESDATDALTWYEDADNDGYGAIASTQQSCTQPTGYVSDSTDCDDTTDLRSPGLDEICNGIDDNCDEVIDEDSAIDAPTWYIDTDVDGYGDADTYLVQCNQPSGYVLDNTDCDDTTDLRSPGLDEVCNDIDDNCDEVIDEDSAIDAPTWYEDLDQDTYGNDVVTLVQCDQPNGYSATPGDCNDGDIVYAPDAAEGCDGEDYNCDGFVDNDLDEDGYADSTCGGLDCDDADPSIYPNANGCYLSGCNDILNNGFSTGDGHYTIDVDGYLSGSDPFEAYCDMTTDNGGWTVIDQNHHSGWSGFFSSWYAWGSNYAGPTNYASPYSWRGWFTLADSGTEFRQSDACTTVTSSTSDLVYRMTGDHYGCVWYNSNCPMSGNTCYECTNPYGTVNSGSCWHLGYGPDADYNPAEGPGWTCGNHWWNNAPSIGTGGVYCVAYR